jgi:superfamily I DNA and RNA helicase
MVDVCSFNTLMWKLTTAGLWRYQSVEDAADIVRAMGYLGELEQIRQRNPEKLQSLGYDAIYIDEWQDFLEEEFRLLKELCRVGDGSEPNLYVFYDDAQNLYGRGRPNWQSIGLNMRGGRSYVMSQCFRNTRPILEASFNVLYGTCAGVPGQVPTKEFGDVATLLEKGLIQNDAGVWRVRFAKREGMKPQLSITAGTKQEDELLVTRLRWLVEEQEVRPEDIHILAFSRQRISQLAEAITAARISGIAGIHVAFKEKDRPLGHKGRLTLSTVASAKGYDAYCVLIASANEFTTDVTGRASFYVGCTRAIEYLEVFAYERTGLATEFEAVLAKSKC